MAGDKQPDLVLASGSPRRRDLLLRAGVRFRVVVPKTDESELEGEGPEEHVRRLALRKARAVAGGLPSGCRVLAADTVVVIDGDLLGKPRNPEDAVAMLLRLAGRTHLVYTGFALARSGPAQPEPCVGVEVSRVRMLALSESEARDYVRSGEPLDKAGAYALQGLGAGLVESVEGSRSNVIGLPMERVLPVLARHGVRAIGDGG